jgi:hypothetical protein
MDATDIPTYRRAVRAHLAERPAIWQPAATLHRHLVREYGSTLGETEQACAVLVSLGHLSIHHDALGGATRYYAATAAGILAHERGD